MSDDLDDLLDESLGESVAPRSRGTAALVANEGSEAFGTAIVPLVAGALVAAGAAVAMQGTNRLLNAVAYVVCGVFPAVLVALFRRSSELRAARRRVAVASTIIRTSVSLIVAAIAVSALNAYMFASFYL